MFKPFSCVFCIACLMITCLAAPQDSGHVIRALKEVSAKAQTEQLDTRTVEVDDSCWVNIIRGVIEAPCFSDLIARVPCDIISTLETDANAALQFVHQCQSGDLPTLLVGVPADICTPLVEAVGIVAQLPNSVISLIGNTVADVTGFFGSCARGDLLSQLLQPFLPALAPGEDQLGAEVSSLLGVATADLGHVLATISGNFGGNLGGGVAASATCAMTTYTAAVPHPGGTLTIGVSGTAAVTGSNPTGYLSGSLTDGISGSAVPTPSTSGGSLGTGLLTTATTAASATSCNGDPTCSASTSAVPATGDSTSLYKRKGLHVIVITGIQLLFGATPFL